MLKIEKVKLKEFKDSVSGSRDQHLAQREVNYIKRLSIEPSNETQKRKNIPISFFFTLIFIILVMSFQNAVFFFTDWTKMKIYYTSQSLISFILLMLGISKFFVSFKELLAYYFLFDTIALSLTASIVGYQGLGATVNVLSQFFAYQLQLIAPLGLFVLSGTIRIIIKYANFKRWQNIIFKISLFLAGMCYFSIGFGIMYFEHKPSRGLAPASDTYFKDFSLLFVFGGLSLHKQYCNLHNRFDRTSRLKYSYKLIDEIEDFEDQSQKQNTKNQII